MINCEPSLQLIESMFFDKRHNARNYMSSCRGWILSSSIDPDDEFCHTGLQLFNPWTKTTIELPRPPVSYSKSPFKFVLSSSPLNSSCKIYLLDKNLVRLAFWKGGMKTWKLINGYIGPSCNDIIYYRNKVVGVNSHGELGIQEGYQAGHAATLWEMVMKLIHSSKREKKNDNAAAHNPRTSSRYLVESTAGDLLMVVRHMEWKKTDRDSIIDEYKTIGFEVYKRKAGKWKEVTSFEDQAVFLAHYNSRCIAAPYLAARKPNCIYFVDDSMEGYYPSAGGDCGVFDMESKTIQLNSGRFGFNKWLI